MECSWSRVWNLKQKELREVGTRCRRREEEEFYVQERRFERELQVFFFWSKAGKQHGEASSGSDYVPEAARDCNREAVREA